MSTPRNLGRACALVLVAAAFLAGGCKDDNGGGGATPNSIINIVPGAFNQGMMAFSPASDTVRVGHIVRLHNGDSITHDVVNNTANGPNWGTIGQGANRDVTLSTAGTFQYHCIVLNHTMSGEVVVLP